MRFIYLLIALGIFSSAIANEVALVKNLKGTAHILRDGKEVAAQVGTKLYEKDTVITNAESNLGLIFKDNTRISVGPKSEFSIEEYMFVPSEKKEAFVTNLSKGSIECISGLISKINPDAFKIKAKSASMGIRGTHFIVTVD
jgi:hypothetical protein